MYMSLETTATHTPSGATIEVDLTRFNKMEDVCRGIFTSMPTPMPPKELTISALEQHICAHLIFHGPVSINLHYNRPFPIKYIGLIKLFETLTEKFEGFTVTHVALQNLA
jgi:hypothetical protein